MEDGASRVAGALKAVVSGAAGVGILIEVLFAGRMVESHFLGLRDHPAR